MGTVTNWSHYHRNRLISSLPPLLCLHPPPLPSSPLLPSLSHLPSSLPFLPSFLSILRASLPLLPPSFPPPYPLSIPNLLSPSQSDTFPLKNIDSVNSSLYAFEMAPLGESATVESVPNHQSNSSEHATPPDPQSMGYMLLTNGGAVSSNSSQLPEGPADSNRVVLGVGEMLRDPWMPSMGTEPSQNVDSSNDSNLDAFGSEVFVRDHVNTPGGKHSKESDSETETLPAKMMRGDNDSGSSPVEAMAQSAPEAMECDLSLSCQSTSACAADDCEDAPANPVGPHPSPARQAVVMEWHSCSICLEEMVDCDLLTHKECGAIVCPSCLQASSEHYNQEQSLVPCPVGWQRDCMQGPHFEEQDILGY